MGQGIEGRDAGRALDAAVMERVFGRKAKWLGKTLHHETPEQDGWTGSAITLPFSTDFAAAMGLVHALAKRPRCWWVTITQRSYGTTKENYVNGGWSVEFRSVAVAFYAPDVYAEAPTLPLAICLA